MGMEQGLSPEQKDFFDSQGRAFSHAQSHELWAASRSENLVQSLLVEDVTGSCSLAGGAYTVNF